MSRYPYFRYFYNIMCSQKMTLALSSNNIWPSTIYRENNGHLTNVHGCQLTMWKSKRETTGHILNFVQIVGLKEKIYSTQKKIKHFIDPRNRKDSKLDNPFKNYFNQVLIINE